MLWSYLPCYPTHVAQGGKAIVLVCLSVCMSEFVTFAARAVALEPYTTFLAEFLPRAIAQGVK